MCDAIAYTTRACEKVLAFLNVHNALCFANGERVMGTAYERMQDYDDLLVRNAAQLINMSAACTRALWKLCKNCCLNEHLVRRWFQHVLRRTCYPLRLSWCVLQPVPCVHQQCLRPQLTQSI